ncbi:MAG: TenA family protein [Tatlockia sp.]|nr:TenA family protein [Tatlockia sp.]
MKIAALLQLNSSLLLKIYNHRFNLSLHKGELSQAIFKSFLKQDELYLKAYTKALKEVSRRLTKETHIKHFNRFIESTLALEQDIQFNYLKKFTTVSFFAEKQKPVRKLPVITKYSQHLLDTSVNASLEEAVISLLPCFIIYQELGLRMDLSNCTPEHPYREWIETYSSEEFRISTSNFIQIADELNQGLNCPYHLNKIQLSFKQSIEFEYRFFEEIFSLNNEIVQDSICFNRA